MQERPGSAPARRTIRRAHPAVRAVLFAALVVLNGIILWPLLAQDELAPGELKAGSFDVLTGKTTLMLDDHFLNELYPQIDLFAGGELVIPAGYSAAVPLRSRLEYRVRVLDHPTAPYVVLGAAVPLPDAVRLDRQIANPRRPPNPAVLADAKVMSADADGTLALHPWDASRPWSADKQWLSALTSACKAAGETLELIVRFEAGKVTLRLGRCAAETTLAETNDAAPMMAVLTGPQPTVVEKRGAPWRLTSHVAQSPVATLAQVSLFVHAGVAAVAIGLVSAVIVVGSLALASLLFPFEAAVVWLTIGILGIAFAAVRLAYRLGSSWGVATLALLAVAVAFALARGRTDEAHHQHLNLSQAVFDESEGTPRCLLTGYSTTADAGLHYGTPGLFGILDTACDRCEGATARVAWRGGELSQIRDTVCAEEGPVAPGTDIILLGGTNDDFQLPLQAMTLADRLRGYLAAARILFLLRKLPKATVAFDASQTLMVAIETARRNVAGQTALIRQACDCARERGAHLWFFHDYIASDLAAGPSPARAFLLDERRRATEAAEGKFVSLLEATGDRAGVSWFNDIVHLSAIGHREAAGVVCRTLEGP